MEQIMDKITMESVTDFYTALIKWGGVYDLDSDKTIIYNGTDDPAVMVSEGNEYELRVLHNGMPSPEVDWTIFNPLMQTISGNPETLWFNKSVRTIMQLTVRSCMETILKLLLDSEAEVPLATRSLLNEFTGNATKKMVGELKKISDTELVTFIYNKSARTAQLQTKIYDDKFMEGKGFSSKSIKGFRAIFSGLLSTTDLKSDYKYKATILNIPAPEARMNIMALFGENIAPYAKAFVDSDFLPETMNMYLPHLEELRSRCGFIGGSAISDKVEETMADKVRVASAAKSKRLAPRVIPTGDGGIPTGRRPSRSIPSNRRTRKTNNGIPMHGGTMADVYDAQPEPHSWREAQQRTRSNLGHRGGLSII